MLGFLVFMVVLFSLIFIIREYYRRSGVRYVDPYDDIIDDDEEEVVTTTTTTTVTTDAPASPEQPYKVVGEIKRHRDETNNQYYVIDPLDGTRFTVEPEHDMYQDDNGEIWKIV